MNRGVWMVPAALAIVLLGGCGGQDTSMPPLTIDPSLTASPTDESVSRSTERQPGVAARAVLQRFLHGLGTADPGVCTLVTAPYAKTAFGTTPCRTWVKNSGTHLRSPELTALKAVQVPTGTRSGAAVFTVPYTELTWPAAAPALRGPLRPRFTLRKLSGHWRVAI